MDERWCRGMDGFDSDVSQLSQQTVTEWACLCVVKDLDVSAVTE